MLAEMAQWMVDTIFDFGYFGIFALMISLTYLAFTLSNVIVKKLGNNLITVVGKIMGLILAIMGTDMIIGGIKLAFGI